MISYFEKYKQMLTLAAVIFAVIFIKAYYVDWNDNYGRVGIASYYSSFLHGRRTASGGVYSKYKLSAAHRKIKLGTKVKVTNLKNKKSVVVVVNDRGPYVKDRIIDLSFEAARQLDMLKQGVQKVKIKILRK